MSNNSVEQTQGYICPVTKVQCDDECCVSEDDCHIQSWAEINSSNNKQSSVNEEFVPYQESLALQELGFHEPCFAKYDFKKSLNPISWNMVWCENTLVDEIYAPTFSQAFKWFRDNFGLSGWVDESFTTNIRKGVVSVKSPKGLEYIQSPKSTMFFEKHEEAELACLRKLIEIVKGGK